MKAEEYLKQSGYNENWPIRSAQICRLMEGYAQAQLKEERERFESRIDKLLQFMNTDQEIEHPHGNYYDRIIYCDGDFYWEADTEGNKPMNLNDVENLITPNPK
jgi:hypothetical protein